MLEALIGILGTACLAIIGWAFNINSKVSVLEQRDNDLKDAMTQLIESRFDSTDSRLDRIERVLNHIEIQ